MKLLKRLKRLFTRKHKPARWAKETRFPIEFAFEAGGVKYFQMANIFNMPVHRGFAAMDYTDQMGMNCDRLFLEGHTKAVTAAINEKNYEAVSVLNHQLAERLKHIFSPDLVYQLAAVLFFDETESTVAYDYDYGAKKIERWRSLDLEDFFMQRPLQTFIPFLKKFGSDLERYTKGNRLETANHLETIISMLSNDPSTQGLASALRLRREKLLNLARSSTSPSGSTTSF